MRDPFQLPFEGRLSAIKKSNGWQSTACCAALLQEAKEISVAATTSKVKAQERLDYLKGYIAETRRYIEDPLRASRDKAMDDVDEARLLAEKAMASLRSALQTLSERSRINEALYLQLGIVGTKTETQFQEERDAW